MNLPQPQPLTEAPEASPAPKVDLALFARALTDDEAAFSALILSYSRRLYAIAYAIVQNETEAEDLVQETFVKAHRERKKIRDPAKFPGWLHLTTRNGARDLLRRRRRHHPSELKEEDELIIDEKLQPPDLRMDEAHVQAHLKNALAQLPEEHRTALTLRYLEGLDHHGIEQIMGISNGALRGLMGRGLAALRRHLEPLDLGRAFSWERTQL